MRSQIIESQNAASIIRDAGGKLTGRTRLQKIAYLLEAAGLGVGFDFEYRHYGPYSDQLADALSKAAAARLIFEEEKPATWGGTYSIFTFTAGAQVPPGPAVSEVRQDFITKAASADPIALELAATAVFLAKEGEPDELDPWRETERRKPEKAAVSLKKAKDLYQTLQAINTPVRLPAI